MPFLSSFPPISEDYTRISSSSSFCALETEYTTGRTKGIEVDFVTKEGLEPTQLIQLCYNLSYPETKEREITGLLAGMKNFEMKEGTIITSDVFDEEVVDRKRIRYVPLWYWLLEKDGGEKSIR